VRPMHRRLGLLLVLVCGPAVCAAAGDAGLVWHVENSAGEVLESRRADDPINPASVVKLATSLRALEKLGPGHRFETRFLATGPVDPQSGELRGDLVVAGGADPDFQPENAFLVAAELNRSGLRHVAGSLVVDRSFWTGWEGGSARTVRDPVRRGRKMATRLRRALDPGLWDRSTCRTWRRLAARRSLDPAHPPRVEIRGGIAVRDDPSGAILLTHRSNPLAVVLRRFDTYSNNDIERLDATTGPAPTLGPWVASRLGLTPEEVRIETSSGLGTNRMTPRQVVALLRELHRTLEEAHMTLEQILPVAGCGPGTLTRFFPGLARTPGLLVGKTGTLTRTDGGIAVLAGVAATRQGDLFFCVAVPGAGRKLRAARATEERWVLDLVKRHGGGKPRPCIEPLPGPATGVEIVPASPPDAP
jgi:D-alanyl-D-alanine carboxypeptidase/D-alanyl-D-alanine-endopeptidase (penicillin-binding protein 4)